MLVVNSYEELIRDNLEGVHMLDWARREAGIAKECFRSGQPFEHIRSARNKAASDAKALGASIADVRRTGWREEGVMTMPTMFGNIHLRPKDTDMLVIRQVFIDGEYDFDNLDQMRRIRIAYDAMLARGHVPIILDAGANIGAASRWFTLRFPQAVVIAVEPDPGNAAMARLNAAETTNVRVIEAAIGSAPGVVKLQSFEDQGWGTRTERADGRADGGIDVVTINDVIASVSDGRLLIAKIDIEGFEGDLFSANTEWVDQATAIIIEPHDWMMPGAGTSQSFQSRLLGKGRELLISGENLVFI